MEISEFVNSIADALTAVLGKDVCGVVSSVKDSRFPVYVIHSITLHTLDGAWKEGVEMRVHSREVSKDCVFRGLLTKLLASLLRSMNEGKFEEHKKELKF